MIAGCGAVLAAAAVLVVPGAAGHAAQTSPRGLTLLFDWLHLAAGSVWLGGLVGVLVLWFSVPARLRVPALSVCVPRFSTVALGSVLVLAATGVGEAVDHMPAVNALWETGYGARDPGQDGPARRGAIDRVRQPALRSRPRLVAAPRTGPAVSRPRGCCVGSSAAKSRSSRRWCSRRRFSPVSLRPRRRSRSRTRRIAKVGPGRVAQTVSHAGYVLQVLVSPNKAAAPDSFALRITRGGQPVRGANVTLLFNHLEMEMPTQEYQLTETQPGVYARAAPALVMVGRWGLTFQITPPHGSPFTALIVDQANG